MAAGRIGVGILGTGGISDMHAEGVRACTDQLDLVAACDTNPATLDEFSRRFNVPRRYPDYRAMLDDKSVQAVIVLAPHHLHVEWAAAVAAAGKHILLEKPIARTLEEADRIIAAARRANVTLLIGHQQRYFPAHRRVRQLLADGAIGDVLLATASHHQDFRVPATSWWRSKDLAGGGCVLGAGIHKLDILRWLLGDVAEVSAFAIHDDTRLGGEVSASVTLRFASGAIGNYVINWAATGPMWETMSLHGRRGRLVFPKADFDRSGPLLIAREDGREQEVAIDPAGYPSMWAHFADCIASGREPLTSGPEARSVLALALSIYQAIQTGKPALLT